MQRLGLNDFIPGSKRARTHPHMGTLAHMQLTTHGHLHSCCWGLCLDRASSLPALRLPVLNLGYRHSLRPSGPLGIPYPHPSPHWSSVSPCLFPMEAPAALLPVSVSLPLRSPHPSPTGLTCPSISSPSPGCPASYPDLSSPPLSTTTLLPPSSALLCTLTLSLGCYSVFWLHPPDPSIPHLEPHRVLNGERGARLFMGPEVGCQSPSLI